MSVKGINRPNYNQPNVQQNIVPPKWNPSLQQKYIYNLDESRINKIHLKLDKASAREVYDDKEINSLNQDITQLLLDAAEEIEIYDPRRLRLVKKNYKKSVKRHKPWFSITCSNNASYT